MMTFRYGRWEVAIARRVGSVGWRARADGVKATNALECGARFWRPLGATLILVWGWLSLMTAGGGLLKSRFQADPLRLFSRNGAC